MQSFSLLRKSQHADITGLLHSRSVGEVSKAEEADRLPGDPSVCWESWDPQPKVREAARHPFSQTAKAWKEMRKVGLQTAVRNVISLGAL